MATYRRTILWVAIAAIFFAMGGVNVVWAFGHPPHFELAWPDSGVDIQFGSGNFFQGPISLRGRLQDFADTFNAYIDGQAHDAKWANILGAVANGIAAITSLWSAFDEWRSARKRAAP
jgi:hypothetical protein